MRALLHRYLSECIYGSNDGLVTTFAIVTGVTDAALENSVVPQAWRFPTAAILTGVTLFVIGASRSLVTSRSWWRNGAEMLGVGAGAATVAFVVGRLLSGLTDSAAV